MVSIRFAMCAALLGFAACKEPSPIYPAGASPEIVQACALTERKCTLCHDRDRYEMQRNTPDRWAQIVQKMRLFPGSAITPADADIIVRCLNHRAAATSFDTHPHRRLMDERGAMYASLADEVQPLHFALHNELHLDAVNTASTMCNSLK